jgi:hypothetical protein
MFKKSSIVILLLSLLLISSCNKEKENQIALTTNSKDSFAHHYPQFIEGLYVWPRTISEGENLNIFLLNNKPKTKLNIYHIEKFDLKKRKLVYSKEFKSPSTSYQSCSYNDGCDWKVSHTVSIDRSWKPGHYIANFKSEHGIKEANFFIPDHKATSMLLFDDLSLDAYNIYGGEGLYGRIDRKGL